WTLAECAVPCPDRGESEHAVLVPVLLHHGRREVHPRRPDDLSAPPHRPSLQPVRRGDAAGAPQPPGADRVAPLVRPGAVEVVPALPLGRARPARAGGASAAARRERELRRADPPLSRHTGDAVTDRSFAGMPPHARLWIFAAPRPLADAEASRLLARVDDFLTGWHAHGHPVVGALDWRHDRFLLLAADEGATGASGCSIDSLYRVLRDAEREIGVPLLDSSRVWFRDPGGEVRSETRPEFRERVARGEVGEDTVVFDQTVASVGAMRAGEWERPLR